MYIDVKIFADGFYFNFVVTDFVEGEVRFCQDFGYFVREGCFGGWDDDDDGETEEEEEQHERVACFEEHF